MSGSPPRASGDVSSMPRQILRSTLGHWGACTRALPRDSLRSREEDAKADADGDNHDQQNSTHDRVMRAFMLPECFLIGRIVEHESPEMSGDCSARGRTFGLVPVASWVGGHILHPWRLPFHELGLRAQLVINIKDRPVASRSRWPAGARKFLGPRTQSPPNRLDASKNQRRRLILVARMPAADTARPKSDLA